MPDERMAASADAEPLPAEGGVGASTDWRAENTRLRQELAKVKDLNRQAVPFVNLALALKNAPGGADIIEKLHRGEALSAKEEKQVAKAASESPEADRLSVEQLEALFDRKLTVFEQRMFEAREAEKQMEKLHQRAAKEFVGYDELRHTPEWKRRLQVMLGMIENRAVEVPDEEPDPYWFALSETWATLKQENPEIGKTRRAGKSESERQGAIVKASSRSAAAPEEEELPEEQAFARRPIRRAGIGGFGKSLQGIRAPR